MSNRSRRAFLADTMAAGGSLAGASLLGVLPAGAADGSAASETGGDALKSGAGRNDPGAAQAAWRELLSALRDSDSSFLDQRRGEFDEYEVARGYRNLVDTLATGVDMYMDNDPDWPVFAQLDGPTKKLWGGHPNIKYIYAPVRGDRRYRIIGQRADDAYLSIQSHRGDPSSVLTQLFFEGINHHRLNTDKDGRFEVIVSPKREGENWLPISPDAASVLARTYVFDRDSDRHATMTIEPLDPIPRPTPLRREDVAARLRSMTQIVRETALVAPQPHYEPNQMIEMVQYKRGDPMRIFSNLDNVYARGRFFLRPSEALVVEGVVVPCDWWTLHVWGPFLNSPDARHHPACAITNAQAQLGKNGEFRVAISSEDPKVPGLDWVDTGGDRQGQFYIRWTVPRVAPEMPKCRVVPLSELRA